MTQTPRSCPRDGRPQGAAHAGSAQDGTDRKQETVSQVVDQAQGVAGQVAEQAKQQTTSQLTSQKDRAVDSLITVAQALRQTGQTLHQQEQGTVAGYVEEAAQRVESVTNYLRAHEVHELIEDTQDLARRQPALFVTGALALGFIGARFLMSSGQRAAQGGGHTSTRYASGVRGAGVPDELPYGGYSAPRQGQTGAPLAEPLEVGNPSGKFGSGGGLEV